MGTNKCPVVMLRKIEKKDQYVKALEGFILEYFKKWYNGIVSPFPITGETNFQKDLRMFDFQVKSVMMQFEKLFSVMLLPCSPLNSHAFSVDLTINDLLAQYGLGGESVLIPEKLKRSDHIEEMYRELAGCPEKSEVLYHNEWYRTGLSLKNGLVSLWDDSDTLEVDIYNVNALELMAALKVRTVDELFKAVKERLLGTTDSYSIFLDEHGIRYSTYSSVPDCD